MRCCLQPFDLADHPYLNLLLKLGQEVVTRIFIWSRALCSHFWMLQLDFPVMELASSAVRAPGGTQTKKKMQAQHAAASIGG
jgi:hypothetical protein